MEYMSKKTKIILAITLGLTFVISIVAAFITASPMSMAHYYGLPYYLLSELIKTAGQGNGFLDFLGWLLFIVIGLSPAIYPTYSIITKKRIGVITILWYVFAIINTFALYFYINPQNIIPNEYFMNKEMLEIAKVGIAFTAYIFVIAIFVSKSHLEVKNEENSAPKYALILSFIIAVVSVFSGTYFGLRNVVVQINSAASSEYYAGIVTLRIIELILYIAPYTFGVLVSIKLISVIEEYKKNCFSDKFKNSLEILSKYVFILIILVLGSAFMTNILEYAFSYITLDINSNLEINLVLLLTAFLLECILSFLKKAIEIKKENELTI